MTKLKVITFVIEITIESDKMTSSASKVSASFKSVFVILNPIWIESRK